MPAAAHRQSRRSAPPPADAQEGDSIPLAQSQAPAPPASVEATDVAAPATSPAQSPDDIVQAAFARLAHMVQISRGLGDDDAGAEAAAEFGRRTPLHNPGPHAAEALRSLDGALIKMAGPVDTGAHRIRDAVDGVAARLRRIEEAAEAGFAQTPSDPAPARAAQAPAPQRLSPLTAHVPAPVIAAPAPLAPAPAAASIAPAQLEALTKDFTDRIAMASVELETRLSAALGGRIDSVEGGLADLHGRLDGSESSARQAIEAVDTKLTDFEQSLVSARAAQTANAETIERLDAQASRAGQSTDERLDRLEAGQATALEALGADVARIDQAVEAGLARAESQLACAVVKLGDEVARVDEAMETRFGRVDALQAQMLDTLGDKVARITERLAERIAAADWRSAQAIEEVGDKMARASEYLSQREERTTADLIDRIALGEERTADILKRAVDRLDTLGEARQWAPPARLDVPPEDPDPVDRWDLGAFASRLGVPTPAGPLPDSFSAPQSLEETTMHPTLAADDDQAPAADDGGAPAPADLAAPSEPPAKAAPRRLFGLFK